MSIRLPDNLSFYIGEKASNGEGHLDQMKNFIFAKTFFGWVLRSCRAGAAFLHEKKGGKDSPRGKPYRWVSPLAPPSAHDQRGKAPLESPSYLSGTVSYVAIAKTYSTRQYVDKINACIETGIAAFHR